MMRLKNILIILLVALVVLGVAGYFYISRGAFTPAITDAAGQPLPGSIASLEAVQLGGTEQWILIRAVDRANPLLLFLHGGPGAAEMVITRPHTAALEEHFLVVHWDQRGAGKSASAVDPESAMNIEQFISDTRELVELLRKRFAKEKVYVVGHSWGSVLGVLTVQRYPELFYAYIGVGQVVHMEENERLSYRWTLQQAREADDSEAIAQLEEIGPPPYGEDSFDKLYTQRQLLAKYGGEIHGSPEGNQGLFMKYITEATEYTILEKIQFSPAMIKTLQLMWDEVMTVNLMVQAPRLEIPVYFMIGRHDYETPFELAERYFETLQAPSKSWVWFEQSAHSPNIEEAEKFNDLLIHRVKQETFNPH
jgi:pimeloyl-ACP methyl ester carboxylesterase